MKPSVQDKGSQPSKLTQEKKKGKEGRGERGERRGIGNEKKQQNTARLI